MDFKKLNILKGKDFDNFCKCKDVHLQCIVKLFV